MQAGSSSWFAQSWRWFALAFTAVALTALARVTVRSVVSSPRPPPPASPRVEHLPRAPGSETAPAQEPPALSERLAAIGKEIFFDASLSEPHGTSCASCHDPAHGFAGNHGARIGVALGSRPGHFAKRNTPSVLYLKFVHRFHFHWEEDAALPDAFGGFFWDGRVDSLAALVAQPLFNPDEMNGGDPHRVMTKLAASPYAGKLRELLGASVLDTPAAAMGALGQAVEAFLVSDEMAPFSSRYDDFIRGHVTLSERELRGMRLFRDPTKGNCASCHKLNPNSDKPERSLFSDFGFESVGIPKNRLLPARASDLGLCKARDGHTHSDEERLCGAFRTPSLRNVTTRTRYMHNGYFSSLRDVVAFYVTRGTNPGLWYPRGEKYDDLPAPYREYVNELSPPYDRGVGEKPRLEDGEIDDIVAFLETLTDAQFRAPTEASALANDSQPQ